MAEDLNPDDILESLGLHPAQRAAQDHLLSLVRGPSTGESATATLEQPQPAPAPVRPIGQPASNTSTASPVAKAVGDMGAMPPPMSIKRPSMFSDAENNISAKHPFWGGVLKSLDVTGRVLSPGLTAQIPGTSLNQQMREGLEEKKTATGLEQSKTQAETEKAQAETEKTKAETAQLGKPESDVKYETTDSGNIIGLFHDPLTDQVTAKVVYSGDMKNPKDAFQLWLKQNPNGKAEEFLAAQQSTKSTKDDKDIADYLAAHNLPDTPANRETARDAIAKRSPSAKVSVEGVGGSWMPTYDEKGHVTGAWNPKTGETKGAPSSISGTTSQGQGIATKGKEADEKKIAPLQSQIDEVANARELKKMGDAGNSAADVDLTLSFFKMMRSATSGSSGIRFTQQEQNLIMGARSLWESLAVQGNKVFSNGEPLSSEQRARMLEVMELHAKGAQRAIDRLKGGTGGTEGKDAGSEGEAVEEYERDSNGKLVKKK